MIGPEHVNQRIKPALHLVVMVRDIGCEIGPGPVRLHHRTVHIVAMFGRPEQRLLARLPIFGLLALGRLQHTLIDQTLVLQILNRRLDPAGAIQRLFAVKHVHLDTQRFQIGTDQVHHRIGREVADLFQPDSLVLPDIGIAHLVLQRLAHVDQIVARICAIGKGHVLPMRFQIPQVNGPRQNIDLRAAVVDVIFARDLMACKIQQGRQRIPKDSTPRVPHMQRPRGVGADIFDVHLATPPHVRPAKIRALRQNGPDDALPDHGRQPQVQEPRPRHIGIDHAVVRHQLGRQSVGDVPRLQPRRFRQHHRGVGRHVPMCRIARRLDRDVPHVQPVRQCALGLHGVQVFDHKRADFGKKVHRSGPCLRFARV